MKKLVGQIRGENIRGLGGGGKNFFRALPLLQGKSEMASLVGIL